MGIPSGLIGVGLLANNVATAAETALGGAFSDAGFQTLLWPTLAAVCVGLAVGVLLFERRVTPEENGVDA